MSVAASAPRAADPAASARIVNDFSIQVATVNGSGSQTANLVLLRSIFQMGVPVSGKNMFPSNIAGLPTWYTIRANKDGYVARKKEVDFLVAMNPETAREDVLSLEPGAAVLYDEPLKLNALRDDLVFYPVPFDKIVAEVCKDAKLRRLVKNMIYDGVLSKLLNIDLAQMEHALRRQMGKKLKAIELNLAALEAGAAYAEQHLPSSDPYWIEPMDKTAGMILVEGNAAAALRLHDGRRHRRRLVSDHAVVVAAGNADQLHEEVPHRQGDRQGDLRDRPGGGRDRVDRHGDRRRLGGRARDDVDVRARHLADGRVRRPGVLRGSARAWCSTSSASGRRPGCRRAPRRATSSATALLSHGDTKQIMLIPASVEECYTMAMDAFDLAERFQTLVFVMSDLDLGDEHLDVAARSTYPERPLDRGKVLDAETLARLGEWGRYKDVDGDGIPYRTIPGHRHAGVFHARLGPQREAASTASGRTTTSTTWTGCARKFETARQHVPKPVVRRRGRRRDRHHRLRHQPLGDRREPRPARAGVRRARPATCGCAPIRSPTSSTTFLDRYERIYVVEQNRDAQMLALMRLDLHAERDRQAAQRAALQRPADRRALGDRRHRSAGRQEGWQRPPHADAAGVGRRSLSRREQ